MLEAAKPQVETLDIEESLAADREAQSIHDRNERRPHNQQVDQGNISSRLSSHRGG